MNRYSIARELAAAGLAALLSVCGGGAALAQVNVTTYHNDNLRTGWNPGETILTPQSVKKSSFGLLQTVTLDDQVDAQPLYVSGETINGSQHNVVYVATENNSVYAIDAQSGQVLLQNNFGKPVYYTNLPGGCNNNGPNVGIDSTPVIDPSSGTLYLIAYTWEKNAPVFRIHAVSLATLADTATPVVITASGMLSNGTTYQFNPAASRQRAALLLANGNVYAGFASFCDEAANESRGWVLGWQGGTLAPLAANKLNNRQAASPDNFFLTSVWMSGYGLAANSAGSVFFVTGNSDYSGHTYNKVTNISESAAEMSGDLSTEQGLFTPSNHVYLETVDGDFGSGGLMLLPPQAGKFPDLAAAAGKDGNLYLLNADNLGKEFGAFQIGGCWCGPSYYQDSNGTGRIVASGGTSVGVWNVKGEKTPRLVLKSQFNGIANGQNSGFFTSVSSNGTTAKTAVVWAVGRPTDSNPATVDLYAIDPDNGTQLYSGAAGAWPNTGGDSNIVPTIANGLVYVASDQMLTILGPGASGKLALPKIRHVDMRMPLAAGEHEIYATMRSMKGTTLTVEKRDGQTLRLDATDAKRLKRFAEPSVGHALIARGTFDKSGVLQASIVLHAKDHSALWPADR